MDGSTTKGNRIWPRRLPACIATTTGIYKRTPNVYSIYTLVSQKELCCPCDLRFWHEQQPQKESGEIFNIVVVVDQQGRRRRTQGCGVGTHTRLASSSILHPIYNLLLPSTEPYQKRGLAAVELLQFSTAVLVFRHLL